MITSQAGEARVVKEYVERRRVLLVEFNEMLVERQPDGWEILHDLVLSEMTALRDLQRERLNMMQVTAVFNRHLFGDDLEDARGVASESQFGSA